MGRKEPRMTAVVFDFDGTLAKLNIDFGQMRRSVLDLLSAYGAPVDGLGGLFVLEMIEAGRDLVALRHPGEAADFAAQAMKRISDIERQAAMRGEMLEGVRDMLLELRGRGIKTGVVTRNCWEAVSALFPNIGSYCGTVVTREMTPRVKPHPGHVLLALERMGSSPERSAMVGDHPMDIRVGKDVGAYTIGVLTGYSGAGPLLEAGADLVIERAADIAMYLP